MTAHVNEECIGCGLCVNICPQVFSMTDSGVAEASSNVPADQEEHVREAADGCPAEAIEVD